ncbi:MAG: cupin domain-containing protein [Gammaproteobacteria bacterium]|nr:cupin domain-containing protein [Gammaproteobacteria bacterium]
MTPQEFEQRIVRYGDLQPCRTAFIDAHTPGSDQKENFTIIGGGVSESADQHVHIQDTPGFNIGAAGQPPNCRNSLHTHRTAEVFFVLKGRWRFFWGRYGDAGEVTLEEGDIFDIPTGMFRGFENIGTDYGMIMAILGGDDAGGGVVWAPEVIEEARAHGLVLAENGQLFDTKKGEQLPAGLNPMPLMPDADVEKLGNPGSAEVVSRFVARYLDLLALSADAPAEVIGERGLIHDRPGFEVDFVSRNSLAADTTISSTRHEILMPFRGHWRIDHDGGSAVLNPGDTCAIPPGISHRLYPSMSGEAALYRVRNTDDAAGPTLLQVA